MPKTTADVAASMTPPMKSAAVTRYAKRYGLLPTKSHAGHPMWSASDVDIFVEHKSEMDAGGRCKACGSWINPDGRANDVPQEDRNPETLCTDEPGEVEGE